MSEESREKFKFNYSSILLIGFGFLASSLTWAIYNAQVPLILSERFKLSSTLIGTVMTIDNLFGVIFQPLIGAWSDNTRTPIGRRLPWILLGLPLCAFLFTLIPLQKGLEMFMLVVIAFNLMMSLWRSPVISLMPDVTPSPLRSQANGIINLMGGMGAIIALLVGGFLSDLREDKFYAFLMGTLVMVFALLILLLFVREPDSLAYRQEKNLTIPQNKAYQWAEQAGQDLAIWAKSQGPQEVLKGKAEGKQRSMTAFLALPQDYKTSLLALLVAIFAWFLGLNAIETFFTLYATHTYQVTGGQASMMLAGFSLSFLVSAIPAGLLGQKIGRKKTILIGLIGMMVIFLPLINQPPQWLLQSLLIIGGALWACININALPMVLAFSTEQTIGSFTGYYYVFSFTASIISPIFYGFMQDFFQNKSLLFLYALICFGVALMSFLGVKHGEEG